MTATLGDVLASSLALLADAASDPGHAFRTLVLATTGLDGAPQARAVVLRRFDRSPRHLHIHTDMRSTKYRELQADSRACLHGWDPVGKIQLRLTGSSTLHTDDDVADTAWVALRPRSRATYDVHPGPGTRLSGPDQARHIEARARVAFCVVRLAVDHLDWLELGDDMHRRARFAWVGNGGAGGCRAEGGHVGTWMVP